MRARRYTIACLAGDGIGPELMAEASRAVAAVSHLHGFAVEENHVPFGGDAVRRFGHPLPPATREVCRDADAVLKGVSGVTGVSVSTTRGTVTGYEVASGGRDVRRELAAAVVGRGWGLLELRPMRMSLEEIFLQVTTEEAAPEAAAETAHE